MTPDERALMHAQERHDAELFSHVEREQPIRADVATTPEFVAGPVTWMDEGDDEPDDGWGL